MRMENPLKQLQPWASARTLVRWNFLSQILLGRCGSRMHLAVSGRQNFVSMRDFHHCLQKAGEGQTANHSVGIPAPCQQLGWDGAQRGTGMGSMWTGFFGSMEGLNFTWILFCRLRVTNSRSRCVSKASVWCGSSPQLSMNWWLSNPSTPMPNLLWGTQKWVRERVDAYYEQLENLPLSILWERYKCKLLSCHCF